MEENCTFCISSHFYALIERNRMWAQKEVFPFHLESFSSTSFIIKTTDQLKKFSSINVLDVVNFTYEQCLKLETRQIKNMIDGNSLQLGKCTHLEDVVYWVTIT